MDVEHVVADHLLPHPAGPLRHLQRELVQVGANGRAPEAPLTQQLVLDGRPLLRHILEGVLLALRVQRGIEGVGGGVTQEMVTAVQKPCLKKLPRRPSLPYKISTVWACYYLLMLLVLHGHQVSDHSDVREHPLESLL